MEFFAIIFNKDDTQLFQELFFRKFLHYDKHVFFFVGLSMIIGVLEENFFYESNHKILEWTDDAKIVIFQEGDPPVMILLMRVANTILSGFLDYWLIRRKFMYYQFLKACFLVDSMQGFMRSSLFFETIIEVAAIHVQSYPEIDSCYRSQTMNRVSYYYYDTTLTAIFLMIRILFFLRSMFYLSIFSSAKAFRICFNNGTESNLLFTVKCEFQHARPRFVIIFVSLYILVFGFLIRLCERSFMQLTNFDWDYVWNAFWIVIVDMTSVGYGDIVPVTNFGRFIIGIVAIGGGAITSLIYIVFFSTTSFDTKQEKAYERIKVHESKKELKTKAMKCVGLSLKFNQSRVKFGRENHSQAFLDEYENFMVDIKNNVKDFANLRKTIIDLSYKRKINDVILFLKEKLTNDFDYVLEYLTIVDFFNKKLSVLLKNVELLSECVSNFEDMYSQIIVNMQYLNQKVLEIFSVTREEEIQFEGFEGKENNYYLVDFINSAQNSLAKIRKSIFVNEEETKKTPERRKNNINDKILHKIQKNKFVTLKKMNHITHINFLSLNDHEFFKTHLDNGIDPNEARNDLMLSNDKKLKNISELSEMNKSRNTKLESQRKSLAYRISVISDSKINISESRNSTTSDGPLSVKHISGKRNTIKRNEKRELTSLMEEGNISSKSENMSESDKGSNTNQHLMIKEDPKELEADIAFNINHIDKKAKDVIMNYSVKEFKLTKKATENASLSLSQKELVVQKQDSLARGKKKSITTIKQQEKFLLLNEDTKTNL